MLFRRAIILSTTHLEEHRILIIYSVHSRTVLQHTELWSRIRITIQLSVYWRIRHSMCARQSGIMVTRPKIQCMPQRSRHTEHIT